MRVRFRNWADCAVENHEGRDGRGKPRDNREEVGGPPDISRGLSCQPHPLFKSRSLQVRHARNGLINSLYVFAQRRPTCQRLSVCKQATASRREGPTEYRVTF